MRIAVIGAGWYGCHLAVHLLNRGHDVTVFDRSDVFAGASGHNQDRVHQGYHYPRSAKTRAEIKYCHDRFVREYPTVEVPQNVFAVANRSLIDFPTYTAICRSAGLEFEECDPDRFGLKNVEGCVLTKERVVNTPAVVERFRGQLMCHLEIRDVTVPELEREFEAVLNCSNLRIPDPELEVFYEAAMVVEATGPIGFPSLTIMDGPFPTVLATPKPGVYTLSQVKHTAVAKCATFEKAQNVLNGTHWSYRAPMFLDALDEFVSHFSSFFEVTGARCAVRTKPINDTDSRECLTHVVGRTMNISCGKFMSVFIAADRVDRWISILSR